MTRPLSALYNSIDKQVIILCKDRVECSGRIVEVDEQMNVVLLDAQESKNGNIEKSAVLAIRGTDISIIRLLDKS